MTKLVARKLKMTQVYDEEKIVPVSIIVLDKKEDLSGFKIGDLLRIKGVTKGKGFQGTVKRHGFHGGPRTHGQKDRLRAPGSIGATTPQKVIKGHKMAGRMGGQRMTLKKLKIVKIDSDKRQIFIKGSLPGNNKGKIEIIV